MNKLNLDNLENTLLEDEYFQFNCFTIYNSETPPHWHNHTEIITIRKGISTVFVNGVNYKCHTGDILLVPHGSLHSIVPNPTSEYIAIVIGDTLFNDLMQDNDLQNILAPFLTSESFVSPIHITPTLPAHPLLSHLVETIITESSEKKSCYHAQIKLTLSLFFTQLTRDFTLLNSTKSNTSHSHNTHTMKKALEYLSFHYQEKISIADLSALSNLSNQHFCRLFKAYTGKTFVQYLTDIRLEQANRLLLDTDVPITQIPERIGFCNPNYFARVYKEKYGFAPSIRRKIVGYLLE